MKWLKKWSYPLLFICAGMVYLTCVDEWQVYAKPLARISIWITGSEDEAERNADVIAEDDSRQKPVGETKVDTGIGDGAGDVSENAENVAESEVPENAGSVSESEVSENAENVSESEVPENTGSVSESEVSENTGSVSENGEPDNAAGMPADKVSDSAGSLPPVYVNVEDDYFADAVFIGDSRTVGMFEYGGLEDISTFYASTGLTVYEFDTAKFIALPDRKEKVTVEEALQRNSFAKVYLMLGINEMGGNMEVFAEEYAEMVARIRELQPDAIIYLQSIMKVSARRDAKGDHITNEGIEIRNERIQSMADNEKIFYLDINPPVCDEGGMISDYTFDGVHLKAKYIELWKQFLKEHAISVGEPNVPELIMLK